ncbi:hypothetical protein F511_27695 [Dorcoceras hygrometricum]|uniref:Uncharacterized protein n=1 Tax=Dorcoceras hygrometricum TaxID=472368 RepID=A0A2Z7CFT2_9LAMI|nr:hypothetical protein F511_27695 [Dorcoceras hygrometricum]
MWSNPSTERNYKTAVNSKNKMQMLCMQPGTTAEGYNQEREPKNSMHSSMEICNRICGHYEYNNSLQEWYRMEELLERSPTLPQTPKTTVGNDGNHRIKSTVNSTRVRETEVDNLENFTKYGIWSHNSDDSVELFRHDTSVGQSQRDSQSGHQSIYHSGSRCMHVCQFNIQCTMHTIQYVKTECKTQSIHKLYHVNHRSISADFTTSITAMFMLKAVKSAQFVPSTADSTSTAYIETVDILQQKPAVALNKNQQQPTDIAFAKEHQNDDASTNQNDTASLQQLTTDSFQNNQQLVALNNSNDVVEDTSPLLPTADQKHYTQNAAFQLNKTTSPLISDWFLKPTAGHSAGTIPHNATADSATIQQSTPKTVDQHVSLSR